MQLTSELHKSKPFIDRIKRILEMAEAGEIYGMAGVLDLGGGEYEYSGNGSFVTNPLVGYAATMKLAKKFL